MRTALFWGVVAIAGIAIMSMSVNPMRANQAGSEVIYCPGGESEDRSCSTPLINSTIKSCDEWWPGMSAQRFNCTTTKKGVSDVTLIADPANYVTAPLSDVAPRTELVDTPSISPWDLEFLPDGSAIVTGTAGGIYLRKDRRFISVGNVSTVNPELVGLMGIAVHPQFSENRYIYLYYTAPPRFDREVKEWGATVTNRLVRFRLSENGLRDREVLLNVTSDNVHSGGRIEFGPDGKLYLTTGDAHLPAAAQAKNTLQGKILRLNPDGSIPRSNPFDDSYVYSRGHRNPQGLAWAPDSRQLYSGEHGPWRYDEINRIHAGANYGWGAKKCGSPTDKSVRLQGADREPLTCFRDWTLAPSGMTFVDDPQHPWYGDLFVAGLRSNHLHRFEGAREVSLGEGEIFWFPWNLTGSWESRRIRDVEFHQGSLWVLGDEGGISILTPS